ncbi:MAG: RluA family pseudouridine synthase [Pseudomonadota bacterium]
MTNDDALPDGYYIAPPCEEPLRILHADDELLIVDKPAFLYTVPGRGPENSDSVITRLRVDYPEAVIIHRLDLDTSGLLMVPRTARARSELSRQIRERTLQKGYEAVVLGMVAEDSGTIDSALAPDPERWPRSRIDPAGKSALTRYRVLARDPDGNRTRLRLDPVTGRQHQLRLHLASIGHPILGCDLYAHEEALRASPRLLLHACELGFVHPGSGEFTTFRSAAPF